MGDRSFVAISWDGAGQGAASPGRSWKWPVHSILARLDRTALALAGILVLAAVLRFLWLGEVPLFHDEAYYYVWSQHVQPFQNLELSFYDHPPAVAYILAMSRAVFGESEAGVRFLFALIGVANVWLVFRLGRYLYDDRVGIIGALLLAINFGHIWISRIATNDVAASFIFTAVIFSFAKATIGKDRRWLFITGLLLGVSFLVKYTLVVVVLGFAAFLFFHKPFRREVFNRALAPSLAVFALCTIPVFAWNYQNQWASFAYQGAHASPFLGLVIGPGSFWENFLVSITYYPMMWLLFSSVPLTLLLVAGLLGAFRARPRRGPMLAGFLALSAVLLFYFDPSMPLPALVALELVVLLSLWLCFGGFQNDRDALLALSSLALILFFAFSLGRMPHWTLPALAPLSLLGARLIVRAHRRLSLSRRSFTVYAVALMALFAWSGWYGASSAVSSGAGVIGPDPKSPVAVSMAMTFSTTALLGGELRGLMREYPGATVLVPQWVTYSPVEYYCHPADMWTFQWDFQIGEVWKKDVSNRARPPDEALVAVYTSSFLGPVDEGALLSFLVYSSYDADAPFMGGNRYTVFNRTGLDTFDILSAPETSYQNDLWFQRHTATLTPYFIAHAWKEGGANVTVTFNNTVYRCPKKDLDYTGPAGPEWHELFYVEEMG
jgi:4-amino-4-deoxy-L-arabinose transferase-like glycosyltransferase